MVRMYSGGLGLSSKLLQWYDRSPGNKTQIYFAGGVGPHGETQRWTYSVPAGKKAWLGPLFIEVMRATAATTVGAVVGDIRYTPQGGTTGRLLIARLFTNSVNDNDRKELPAFMLLQTGDTLTAYTADGSTGGTMNYTVQAMITEFNA